MMRLPLLTPDSTRSDQVRANCRRRFERTRRRSDRLAAAAHVGRRIVTPVAALLGAAYIVNLVGIALRTLSASL
jgi:hypothetical protein